MKRILFIFFLFVFWFSPLNGQEAVKKIKSILFNKDTLLVDSNTVLSGTVRVFSKNKELKFKLLPDSKSILIQRNKDVNPGDSLVLLYSVLPIDLSKKYFHKDISTFEKNKSISINPFSGFGQNQNFTNELFSSDKLNKNGSISRGILFGNNQDVVLNSNMNLQVSGKLTKDIEILLAATDNSIPIQAEGNTQQLQEFDKVYVQLNNKNSKLIVGDFQYGRPSSYFMNFYKRTQGIYVSNFSPLKINGKDSIGFYTQASAAVSRGKFCRFSVQGVENNQGPYRLRGSENEQFIIVLSGTEKIYIDGKLLERGQENDYIIDYNSAEITFTAKQIITKDKRIVAEFQYAERNYSRSLLFLSENFRSEKWKGALHFYSEQDNKNRPFQQDLSEAEKKVLFQIGDTLEKAVTEGATIAEFNTVEVFYQKKDTITASGTYRIFEYSTAPDTAYRVRFSYVGENKGNYVQIQSVANGKVFEWREPVNGLNQGNYEAVIPLVTPKQKQMLVASASRKIGERGIFDIETSITKNDVNTFSPLNSNDDNGGGLKLNFLNKEIISQKENSEMDNPITFIYGVNYEFLHKQFSQIERFRAVEFNRDWNRTSDSIKNNQHITSVTTGFEKKGKFKSLYTGQNFLEQNLYRGFKHNFANSIHSKNTVLIYNGSFLSSETKTGNSGFFRHKSFVSRRMGKITITYIDEFEKNKFLFSKNDSLLFNSYQFWEWETNITNSDTSGNRFKLFYRERTDKKPKNSKLIDASYAQNIGGSMQLITNPNHILTTTITYRKLVVRDTTIFSSKPDNTLLSRIEYSPRIWKGFLQANIFYETGYGLEPRREYSFIQVAAGQGQYTWNDYNGDGIKQLNEFEIAQFSDQATFVKVFTPTNVYVKASHDQLSGSLFIRPAALKKNSSGRTLKFIGRFASQTVYRIDKKKTVSQGKISYNPFENQLQDSSLLFSNFTFRQALFFNQSSSIGGFDYTYQKNESKQLLTNGFESRAIENHELRTRVNFNRSIALFTESKMGIKKLNAELFTNRNYALYVFETEPKIVYQPNTSTRISSGYKYSTKQNAVSAEKEKAILKNMNVELRLSKLSKGNFTARIDYIEISFPYAENTPVAFEMLNSLRPGQNITWTLNFQQNLNSNLQISVNYDGRKTPGNKIIHIGGAEVRAFF